VQEEEGEVFGNHALGITGVSLLMAVKPYEPERQKVLRL
jgi:hypothetical protein